VARLSHSALRGGAVLMLSFTAIFLTVWVAIPVLRATLLSDSPLRSMEAAQNALACSTRQPGIIDAWLHVLPQRVQEYRCTTPFTLRNVPACVTLALRQLHFTGQTCWSVRFRLIGPLVVAGLCQCPRQQASSFLLPRACIEHHLSGAGVSLGPGDRARGKTLGIGAN